MLLCREKRPIINKLLCHSKNNNNNNNNKQTHTHREPSLAFSNDLEGWDWGKGGRFRREGTYM